MSLEFHASNDKSMCLDWFVDRRAWGAWRCHHATNEQFRSQAPRVDAYCAHVEGAAMPARCVSVYRSSAVMRVHSDGGAGCIEFVAPLEPLRVAPCSSSPRQLWRYEAVESSGGAPAARYGALRYARDATLCVDWFASGGGRWGVWTCDTKSNQRFMRGAGKEASESSGGGASGGRDPAGSDGSTAVNEGERLCSPQSEHQSGSEAAQCVQRAAEDGNVMISRSGDAHCLRLSEERLVATNQPSPSSTKPRRNETDDDDDEEEEDLETEEDKEERGAGSDGSRVDSVACSHADPRQRWRFDVATGSFSPVQNASQCFELTARAARSVPCVAAAPVPSAPSQLSNGVVAAASGGSLQRFEWDAGSGLLCASILSSTQ